MIDNFEQRFDLELTRWRSRTPHLDQWRDYSERYLEPTDIQEEGIERVYDVSEPF